MHKPEHASLNRSFTAWLKHVCLPKLAPEMEIPDISNLEEAGKVERRPTGRVTRAVFACRYEHERFGEPVEKIMSHTGLTRKEIEALRRLEQIK